MARKIEGEPNQDETSQNFVDLGQVAGDINEEVKREKKEKKKSGKTRKKIVPEAPVVTSSPKALSESEKKPEPAAPTQEESKPEKPEVKDTEKEKAERVRLYQEAQKIIQKILALQEANKENKAFCDFIDDKYPNLFNLFVNYSEGWSLEFVRKNPGTKANLKRWLDRFEEILDKIEKKIEEIYLNQEATSIKSPRPETIPVPDSKTGAKTVPETVAAPPVEPEEKESKSENTPGLNDEGDDVALAPEDRSDTGGTENETQEEKAAKPASTLRRLPRKKFSENKWVLAVGGGLLSIIGLFGLGKALRTGENKGTPAAATTLNPNPNPKLQTNSTSEPTFPVEQESNPVIVPQQETDLSGIKIFSGESPAGKGYSPDVTSATPSGSMEQSDALYGGTGARPSPEPTGTVMEPAFEPTKEETERKSSVGEKRTIGDLEFESSGGGNFIIKIGDNYYKLNENALEELKRFREQKQVENSSILDRIYGGFSYNSIKIGKEKELERLLEQEAIKLGIQIDVKDINDLPTGLGAKAKREKATHERRLLKIQIKKGLGEKLSPAEIDFLRMSEAEESGDAPYRPAVTQRVEVKENKLAEELSEKVKRARELRDYIFDAGIPQVNDVVSEEDLKRWEFAIDALKTEPEKLKETDKEIDKKIKDLERIKPAADNLRNSK